MVRLLDALSVWSFSFEICEVRIPITLMSPDLETQLKSGL